VSAKKAILERRTEMTFGLSMRLVLAILAAFMVAVAAAVLPESTPAEASQHTGRWIYVDTNNGLAMAIQGNQVVRVAYVTVGTPSWPTPKGNFTVQRRVLNETMDSSTIGIPRNSPGGYYLTDVLYTQYFYGGAALHYNYWSPPSAFGSAGGSHGCVGMTLDDARFFWNFATVGTPVVVR
jgi:lipoprotein-anchoring transpeptidase ErfK/SrfK